MFYDKYFMTKEHTPIFIIKKSNNNNNNNNITAIF